MHEAIGGILFGFLLGFIAHVLISSTDDGSMEILITLTIPTAGFMFASNILHVSGALAMVVAGIMIGNWTRRSGFSESEPTLSRPLLGNDRPLPKLIALLSDRLCVIVSRLLNFYGDLC